VGRGAAGPVSIAIRKVMDGELEAAAMQGVERELMDTNQGLTAG
jgi:hypothetical protein